MSWPLVFHADDSCVASSRCWSGFTSRAACKSRSLRLQGSRWKLPRMELADGVCCGCWDKLDKAVLCQPGTVSLCAVPTQKLVEAASHGAGCVVASTCVGPSNGLHSRAPAVLDLLLSRAAFTSPKVKLVLFVGRTIFAIPPSMAVRY